MEQDVYRIKDETPPTRRLSPRAPRRNRAAAFAVSAVAILLGAAAGLVWMSQTGMHRDNRPAETELVTLETAEATPAGVEAEADADDASDPAADAVVERGPVVGVEQSVLGGQQPASAATSRARIQEVLAARGPTVTPSPVPPLAQMDAVVARGGAQLRDEATGLITASLPQGALVTITARSPDGRWLYGRTESGAEGWLVAEQVIAFDASRLRSQAVTLTAGTPTPQVEQVLMPTPTPDGVAPASAAPATAALDTPGEGLAQPMARINLTGSRLNVRAGPDASHAIVTKAHPDEVFVVLGRAVDDQWLQLAIPDVEDGFGWVLAEYVDVVGNLETTPVSEDVSRAPPYVEGAEAERVRQQRQSVGHQAIVYAPAQPQPEIVVPVAKKPKAPVEPRPVARPSVTGLEGTLAIQTSWGQDIYLYDLVTSELRWLTTGFDPALSPDGAQVAFTRSGGDHGLYLIHTDGSNERMIFNGRELLRSPSWSPDGGFIVFERGDEFTDCRNVQPRCPSSLTPPRPSYPAGIMRQPMLARVDVHGQQYRDLPVLQSAAAPDWSHAGVVYASAAGIQLTQDRPDVNTQEVYFQIQKQYEMSPALQPHGETVLFQRREASHWEIYRVNLDGSGLHALTRPEFTLVRQLPANVSPIWSPDGRHIAFLSNRQPDHEAGEWAIWVMEADGGNQRKLPIDLPFTYTYVGERMLSWSR